MNHESGILVARHRPVMTKTFPKILSYEGCICFYILRQRNITSITRCQFLQTMGTMKGKCKENERQMMDRESKGANCAK